MVSVNNRQVRPNNKPDSLHDFSTELKRSKNFNELKENILKIINRLGFSDYTFAPLERDWAYENQQGFLSTYPDEFWRIYQEEELYNDDMLMRFVKDNTHSIFTSHIYDYFCNAPFENEVTRINRTIRQLHHSFGFFEQHVTPIITADNEGIFLLSLSQQNMDAATFQATVNRSGPQIRSLGECIFKVCQSKFPHLFSQPPKKVISIAPKPLQVLATLANEDLTITDLADKLCISPITAHQHIAAARKALGKNTNIGAIKKAMSLGLISYDAPSFIR